MQIQRNLLKMFSVELNFPRSVHQDFKIVFEAQNLQRINFCSLVSLNYIKINQN